MGVFSFLTSDISQAANTVYDRMQANSSERVYDLSESDTENILNAYVTIGNGNIFNPTEDSSALISRILAKVNITVASGWNKSDAVFTALYELFYAAQDNANYSAPCLRVLNQNTTNNAGVPGLIQSQGGGGSPSASKAIQDSVKGIGTSITSLLDGLGVSMTTVETVLIVVAILIIVINLVPVFHK
jgi:hypothetical protein